MTGVNTKEQTEKIFGMILRNDLKKIDELIAPDVVFESAYGIFHGLEEFKRYLTWTNQRIRDMELVKTGVGMMGEGNRVVFEGSLIGKMYEIEIRTPIFISIIFDEIGRAKRIHQLMDRLSFPQQVATQEPYKSKVKDLVDTVQRGI